MRESHGPAKHGKAKASFATFIDALVLHALSSDGSLGAHLRMLTGSSISDSATQQRRASLDWSWFEALFAHLLRPLAKLRRHPECFYGGMRLLAVDGSSWSLVNTPQVTSRLASPSNQKGQPGAFPKFMSVVLLELGTHQPLGAQCEQAVAAHATGEITLAKTLLGQLPAGEPSLLLADRLYGGAGFIHAVRKRSEEHCQLLVRVIENRKARVLEVLSDGSALVEVMLEDKSRRKQERKPLRLREIRAEVRCEGEGKKSQLRLWTTLLNEHQHPATELARLYTQRWEAELFFRELKTHTRRDNLMRAGSIEGAQAEFGALILAASLLAAQRLKLAEQEELPAVRLSIHKIARHMQQAALVLSLSHDLMSGAQQRTFIRRFEKMIRREAQIPPRRQRSCPRGLRKPTASWPRIRQRHEAHGSYLLTILPSSFP